ncbi:LysR family transcriptional regulator [Neisseria weixii]|uniref:LysR family transcriptional regulator n=1 Tax=Neisseria weixii TaxID=1853276 RepID=A0A3N4ML69_9NEIS|nr:LysR family transcriptional regulator [Neisseria weixii]RPD83948.1 LysR family transcriptional regulator [Neisseria weixii]RPD84321.1 LysR family transcriptional regulator [Neisseria weixii]
MPKINYNSLFAFLVVAQEKNFAQASAKLGVSPQALSQTIKVLEQQLGLQLLNRTTRTVSLTQAGNVLFGELQNGFEHIQDGIGKLAHLKDTPSGKVRINASLQAIDKIFLPKLKQIRHQYPQIEFELINDNRFVDIVAEGFDAGVRLGSDVGDEMIAVKISQEMQMALVASPDYVDKHGFVQHLDELRQHWCIGYQMKNGKVYAWQFDNNGVPFYHTPDARLQVCDSYAETSAAKEGLGLAYVPLDLAADDLTNGRLIRMLITQSQTLPALYLYYPHRNISPALRAVVEVLKV